MIRVFLVEDEIAIRESIRKTIPWEREGFDLVGEAGDGELAYPQILQTKPDILLTDIRMPFMGGLELAGLVRRELPRIRILVLSGFDDFEYARQAIHIGVEEYLLKPLTEEELLEKLRRTADSIREERQEQQARERYEREREESLTLARQQLFHEMLDGRLSTREAAERGEKLGLALTAPWYRTSLLQLCPGGEQEAMADSYSDIREQITEKIREEVGLTPWVYLYEQVGDVLCFLEKAGSAEELEDHKRRGAEALRRILDGYPDVRYFLALGRPADRIREVGMSYNTASKRFAERYFCDGSAVFDAGEDGGAPEERGTGGDGLGPGPDAGGMTDAHGAGAAERLDYRRLDLGKMEQKYVLGFLRSGGEYEVDDFTEDYLESLGRNGAHSILLRQYVVMGAVFCVLSFMESLGLSKEEVDREFGDFSDALLHSSPGAAGSYLKSLFRRAIRIRNREAEQKNSGILEEAKSYIRGHYAEDISLRSVAARVNASPNYFSSIFSEECGKTFIEYLTEVRMERARELLVCSAMRTSDIGYEVGYRDPHYFSFVFKKTQGVTPKEYRRTKRTECFGMEE